MSVPAAELMQRHPGASGEWVNFYDDDDVIAYPLQPLGEAYRKSVRDVCVKLNGLFTWTPMVHPFYWADDRVMEPMAKPLAPGQVGRYDDSFEVRAFGDNMTRWGTPSVLIETGPWPSRAPDEPLVQLNFVALATALDALASRRAARADVARYESIPENDSSGLVYLLLKGVGLFGADGRPFTADVGISVNRAVRDSDKGPQLVHVGRVEELGDLRVLGALESVDGSGLLAVPLSGPGAKEGDTVHLPEPKQHTLQLGQPAELMLLKPLEKASTYRVERIIRFDR
ncbi:M14 family metallopeptidase [Archangium lipolyticum]|uniref:hypothetical protein n=1 Tax=Archangium lipolyticum TaxID=2970465 RepID=UPI002149A023|nr:hypothetical protein [Archangium lipolyticum]